MRIQHAAVTLTILSLCWLLTSCQPLAAQEQSEPKPQGVVDQPYVPVLETLIDHVGEGRIEDAVAILQDETTKGVPEATLENLKRSLAAIYGGGGKYDGNEVVAMKAISSRVHVVYALGFHQRQPLVYTFTMYQFEGRWKIHHVHWGDNINKLAEVTGPARR